jgi:hypothetical protein
VAVLGEKLNTDDTDWTDQDGLSLGYDVWTVFYFILLGEGLVRQFLLFVSTLSIFSWGAVAQNSGLGAPPAVTAPAHPITEVTLRKYFDVCHFVYRNRQQIDAQWAVQKKTLPSWYPGSVWDEIGRRIDLIDVVSIALPIYQKYWSEEAGQNAIRLFLTPAGQAMVNKFNDTVVQHEDEGDEGLQARRKAMESIHAEEDARVHKMMRTLKPEDQRTVSAFVQSAEWVRLNQLGGQIASESPPRISLNKKRCFVRFRRNGAMSLLGPTALI